ncbi:hypothetical protein TNCV_210341 [Trichonephila clavipes]|uniref:Uncharacterized protein n=1 Tax=Trichonephila clavipes TaxID=2585209 RepID=A0A8X6SUQ8_TRICX|nr:hypothetical protein TNCV_210341 [Trichonephila clavipes]
MHLAHDVADCCVRAAQRLCAQRYLRSKIPSHALFACLNERLSYRRVYVLVTQKRERRGRTPNNEETVHDLV